MCLNPIKIWNPTRRISYLGGQRYQIEIPCGQCSECREARRTEIYFRSWYECQYTWKNNGYVYFDTLTYDNLNLPHISDFCYKIKKGSNLDYSCFNKDDVRDFIMRLRRHIEYHYDANIRYHLKYFVASEYGSEKYTARPHYHILFFVTTDKVSPVEFSKAVNECWQHGRTDGIDYHDYNYLMDHVYGPKYNSDDVHMRAVCNYVAKYVLKDSEFEGTLQKRISKVFGHDISDREGFLNTFNGQKYLKKIMKYMRPYTRWSKGFGEYGLEYNTDKDMYNNKMRIPDKNTVWRFAPLSSYLLRKKYYVLDYDMYSGKAYWKLNDLGRQRAWDNTVKGCQDFTKRFEEWYANLDLLMKKGDKKSEYDWSLNDWIEKDVTSRDIYEFRNKVHSKVKEYLDGRDLLSFAVYVFFYKGRVKTFQQLEQEKNGVFRAPDLKYFFDLGFQTCEDIAALPKDMWIYNYAHSKDKKHFQMALLSDKKFDCDVVTGYTKTGNEIVEQGYNFVGFDYGYDTMLDKYYGDFVTNYNKKHVDKCISAEEFSREYVINENSDPRFKDFDKLYDLYCSSLQYYNRRKQDTYDYIEAMKIKKKY